MDYEFGPTGIGSNDIGPAPVATTTGRHTAPLHAGQLRRRYRTDFSTGDIHTGPRQLEVNFTRRHRTEPWSPSFNHSTSSAILSDLPSHHSIDTVLRGARPLRRRYGSHLRREEDSEATPHGPIPLRGRTYTDLTPGQSDFPYVRHRRLYESEPSPEVHNGGNGAATTGFRYQSWPDDASVLPVPVEDYPTYYPALRSETHTSCAFCGDHLSPGQQVGPYCFCDDCSTPLRSTPTPTCARIARTLPERLRAWQLSVLVFIWCILLSFMGWYTKNPPPSGRLFELMSAGPRAGAMGFSALVLLVARSYDVFVETPPAVTARQYTLGAMIISRTVRSLLISLQMLYLASFIYLMVWLAGLRWRSELFARAVATFMLHLVMDFDPGRVTELYLYVILGVVMALVNGSFFTVVMSMLAAWAAIPRWSEGSFMELIRRSVGMGAASVMQSVAGWAWFVLMHVLLTVLILLDVLSIGVEFWHLRYDWYQHVTPWGIKSGGMVVESAGTAAPEMTMV